MASEQRITVAQVVLNLDIGGMERVVIDLTHHLNPSRFLPVVYCLGDGGVMAREVSDAGFRVRSFRKKPGISWGLAFRIRRAMREDGVRVAHCHNWPALLYAGPAARLSGSGVVYTPHGVESSLRREVRAYRRLGFIHHVVAVSEDTRRLSVERGGFKPESTQTVVNGVNVARFAEADDTSGTEQMRASLGLLPNRRIIGIVARLVPEKDHETLLDALGQMTSGDTTTLLIIGDGPLRARLEERTEQANLGDRVRFLGARNDVDRLLRILDVFVLSSHTEGLSVTLLEAMAAGLPIVATDVGGNAEAVADGETGLIVPPRDAASMAQALDSLARDTVLARRMGENGLQRARERFSVEAMASQYEKVYERILASASH